MEYLEHFRLIFIFFLAFLSYRHVHQEILPVCQGLDEEEEDVRQEEQVGQMAEVQAEGLQEDGDEAVVPQQNVQVGEEIVDEEEDGFEEAQEQDGPEVELISDCTSAKEAKREGKTKLIKKLSKQKRKDPNPKKSATPLQESSIIDFQAS